MGAKHSVSSSVLEAATTNVVQSTTQNCASFVDSGNQALVTGNGDVISNVAQQARVVYSASCPMTSASGADLSSVLDSAITGALGNTQVALTQWMDTSRDTVKTGISQAFTSAVTTETLQNCMGTVSGTNLLQVDGSGDVVYKLYQSQSADVLKNCAFGSSTGASVVADMTAAANQSLTATTKNPFAFLTDAFDAIASHFAYAAAAVFIFVVCLVGLYFGLRRRPAPPAAGAGAGAGAGARAEKA